VFVSVDPLVTTTMQPYIYGGANPVSYADPSGLCIVPSTLRTEYERDDDGNIVSVTVTGTRMRGPECDPTDCEGGMGEDGYDFDNPAGWGSDEEWEQHGEKHEIYWHVSAADTKGGVGLSLTVCLLVCVSGGLYNDRSFLTVGQLGLGAAVNLHYTTEGACAQQGWSQGGSFVPGVGGGVSMSTPLPDGEAWWTAEPGNVDVTVSYGGLFQSPVPHAGGTSYTRVAGC